jgi:hypothetical protein
VCVCVCVQREREREREREKTSKMRGDCASCDEGTALHVCANRNKVFKIVTVDSVREW